MGTPAGRAERPGLSFRAKITGLSLIATTGGLAVAFALFVLQGWIADRITLSDARISLANSMAGRASEALHDNKPELAHDVIEDLQRIRDLKAATFYTIEGKSFLHWGGAKYTAGTLDFVSLSGATSKYHSGILEVHAPVLNGEQHVGELVLISGERDVERNLGRNTVIGLGLFGLGALISGLVAYWLSGRVLKPLSRLAAGMEQVRSTKDFSVMVEPTSADEFGWLTERFNALLAELQSNDAALHRALTALTEARDAADAANIMKSQFLANMSHEIRTPLNGVLGMAQVMAMDSLSPPQQERLDVIRRSGESLLAILNDLLDLSKIEAGKLEFDEEPFDLAELASGAHAAFTSVAEAKGLGFSLQIADRARGVWNGDSVRVRQVLYNLISNALKFTTHGQVDVMIDAPEVDGARVLRTRVQDTGIGIAEENLETLFDKFVQADSSTTRRFGGTGLGLSICRELVSLMGGSIDVQSTPGKGTCFEVVLPLAWLSPESQLASPPAPTPTEQQQDAADSGPPLRVLAAEDNETNQTVLRTILETLGVELTVVDNGQQALDAWLGGGFDLILMDIQMPVMDGVAATRKIRAAESERGLKRTPIVALSANAMKHQVAEYLEAGMDAHLAKPIQIEKLYAVLAAYAEEARAGDRAAA